MPAGIGFHPYFEKHAGSTLRFNSIAIWPPDAPENLLKGVMPHEDGLDFSQAADISGLVSDRLFDGWDGVMILHATLRGGTGAMKGFWFSAIVGFFAAYAAVRLYRGSAKGFVFAAFALATRISVSSAFSNRLRRARSPPIFKSRILFKGH